MKINPLADGFKSPLNPFLGFNSSYASNSANKFPVSFAYLLTVRVTHDLFVSFPSGA